MADEILGNLSVNITGDYSELSDAIDQATSDATQGATEIANAFNVPDAGSALAASISAIGDAVQAASGDVASFGQAAQSSVDGASALSDAAAPLAGSLNDAGDAANSAGGSLGGFGDNASQAAGDAQEAEGGVQSLAEQFVALGEALAVTEGLKEFGQEALTAYGTVQSVTIGLTQLTKSAEQADEIVTQIKELAATEPFAFPEIAPTIQKMVALGVSAEQIPGVMQAVADAAAATGNQFSQVANSFDRMTLSGTVSARSLVQLGVNTQQLGAAMGVAADQVKAAFLAMDQTDRINILEAAMGKFAGAAEAQAQGISGQWQIFQNTFEEVMVGVGEAIAPVVGDILDFGKTVLTEVQSAIAVFNELPSPVKDVVVVLGLVAAAVVPLTGLVSGLGFAWIGLQSAGTALTAIMTALGIAEGEAGAGALVAAAGARTAAVAVEGLGAASAGAAGAGGVGGLATTLGFLGGVVLPATIGAIAGFGIATAKDLYLPTDNVNSFNEEMGAFTQDVSAGTTEVNAFGGAIPGLTANVQTLGGAVTVVSANLTNLLEPLTAVTAKQMSANSAFNNANVAVQLAKVALANAQQQYDGTAQSAASLSLAHQVLTRAVVNLDSATQAATPHAKNYGDTIAGVTQNLQLAQEKFQSLESVFATVSAAMAAGTGNVSLQAEAYTKLESAAKASGNAFASYQGILAQVQVTTDQAYASYQQLGAAYGTLLDQQKQGIDVTAQLANVYQQWQAAGTKVGIAVTTIAGQMALFTTAAQKQTTTLTDNVGAFAKFAAIQQPTVTQVDATKAAFEAITSQAAAMGIQLTQTDQGFGFVAAAGTSATPALQAFIDKLNGILGATGPLVDVNGKWVQSMAALPAWLQQLVAGLQKQTAAAKDATAATQAHTGSMSDNAAQATRTAQAQIDLGSTYQTVAKTVQDLTNAGKNQVTNLENMVGAFTSLNSSTQTTISGQVALQNALKGAQSAGAALGITITSTGATTASTNPAIIALTKAINDQIAAANSGANSNQNYVGSLQAIASAAKNASDAVSSFDQILAGSIGAGASGGQGITGGIGSLVSQIINGATTTQELMPPDPNPGQDHWVQSSLSWVPDTAPGTSTGTSGGWQSGIWNDGAAAVAANTTATTANTTATSSNSTATTAATTATSTSIPVMTAYTGSINAATGAYTAGTQAVTNFGNAVPLGTAAVNQLAEGIQTYLPVIAGVTDTTTLASQAIQANALAFAGSTSATGAATAAQIEAMYVAEGFSQQMAIAGADAVLGIQNTTTAMVPLAQAVGTLTTASNTLSDSLTGSSGLQPAVDSTTASLGNALTASDGLTKGLGDATTAFSGSSGLNAAVGSIDKAISGPSGLTGVLGNLTDAAGQAAGALKSVGTSGGIATSSNPSPGTTTTVTAGPQPPGTGWTLNASGTGWVGGTLPLAPAPVWASGALASPAAQDLPTDLSTSLTSANFLAPAGGLTQDQQDLLTEQAAVAQQTADTNNASVSAAQVQQDYSNVQTAAAKVQQNYADAQANAANAQNAYTNALDAATDPLTGIVAMTPQIEALRQAAIAAAQTLESLSGNGTFPQSRAAPQTSFATNLTAADFLPAVAGLTQVQTDKVTEGLAYALVQWDNENLPTDSATTLADIAASQADAVTVQNDYAAAQAAAANAQNAYTNALNAATNPLTGIVAMTPQIEALRQAAIAAAQTLESLSGNGPAFTDAQAAQVQAAETAAQLSAIAAAHPFVSDPTTWAQQLQQALTAPDTGNKLSTLDPNNPNNILTPVSQPINLTVQVNAGTVVGSNAAQQLVNMVMPQMVAQLRQAGVKI